MSLDIEAAKKKWKEQPMLRPKIESVIINVSLGQAGNPLNRAKQIIEDLTGQTPVDTVAKNTWRAWGIRKNQSVGCKVTVKGQPAYELLMRLFHANGYQLKERSIARTGNFGFGIIEHINIPGMSYNPNLGIIGMDVVVQMSRAGYRVKLRQYKKNKISTKHTFSTEDTKVLLVYQYGIELV